MWKGEVYHVKNADIRAPAFTILIPPSSTLSNLTQVAIKWMLLTTPILRTCKVEWPICHLP